MWPDSHEEIGAYIHSAEEALAESLARETDADDQEKRREAESLTRSETYARARNDGQRRYLAKEMYPGKSEEDVALLLELASLISWDTVEPEREQALAKQAAQMPADRES